MGSVYQSRSKTFCGNSGTIPSFAEQETGDADGDRVTCSECGRVVAVTIHGLISHHGPIGRATKAAK